MTSTSLTATSTLVRLAANRVPNRFYRGGAGIGDFQGHRVAATHEPEDWVGSTTCVHGEQTQGLSRLPDGRVLREAIESHPTDWLGRAHVDRFGANTMLLVKLLDAGQRLPVHAHPRARDVQRWWGGQHGKAEAWYVVRGGTVHLGLREDLGQSGLEELLYADEQKRINALHRIEVHGGDVVYVPAGTLHAIGEGVLVVEVQEPTDYSILLEHSSFGLNPVSDGHLGLGYPAALEAIDSGRLDPERISSLVYPAGVGPNLLPVEADAFFRLDRAIVDRPRRLEPGFAVIVVTGGSVVLRVGDVVHEAPRGSTFVAPHGAGPIVATGAGELIVCRPPAP